MAKQANRRTGTQARKKNPSQKKKATLAGRKKKDVLKKKAAMSKTKFGDAFDPKHVDSINKLSKVNLE